MTESITLPVHLARDLAYSDVGDLIGDDDTYEIVANEYVGRLKYTDNRWLVIRHKGRLYATNYEIGVGDQEVAPFDYVSAVTLSEVVARPKVVTEYVTPSTDRTDYDPRELARRFIQEEAETAYRDGIRSMFEEEWADLPEKAREARVFAVRDLVQAATVVLTWPADTP